MKNKPGQELCAKCGNIMTLHFRSGTNDIKSVGNGFTQVRTSEEHHFCMEKDCGTTLTMHWRMV